MCSWNRAIILQDLVLAVIINTSAMLLSYTPIGFFTWYPGVCTAFLTNVLIQLVLPVPAIASMLTSPLEGRAQRPLCSIFLENLMYVTLISLTMAVVQTGMQNVLAVWTRTCIPLLLIGYAASLAMFAITRTCRQTGDGEHVRAPFHEG